MILYIQHIKNNMTDILAALGLIQLKRYDDLLRRRFEIIDLFEKLLDKNKIKIISHQGNTFRSSGHLLLCNLVGFDVEKKEMNLS